MSDTPSPEPFDLRIMPDWVRDESPKRFDKFEDDFDDKRSRHGRDRKNREEGFRDRRDRPERPRRAGEGGPKAAPAPTSRDDRPPRPGGGGGGREGAPSPSTMGGQAGPRREGPGRRNDQGGDRRRPQHGHHGGPNRQGQHSQPQQAPVPGIRTTILPAPEAIQAVVAQIRAGHQAYPLFGLAKKFLEKPDRYRVRLEAGETGLKFCQTGDFGPVAREASALERIAFEMNKERLYERTEQIKEEIKGNFTSVARCRTCGTLLGPPNYHDYQPALRRLYERRYQNRMSFEDFRRSIETTNDAEAIEAWKEQARKVIVFVEKREEPAPLHGQEAPAESGSETPATDQATEPPIAGAESSEVVEAVDAVEVGEVGEPVKVGEPSPEAGETLEPAPAPTAEPTVVGSIEETRAHFRANHFESGLRVTPRAVLSGVHARKLPDAALVANIREAFEAELRFPGNLANALRAAFQRHGLQIFKHRKRFLYVGAMRPQLFESDPNSLSDGVRSILEFVGSHPGCDKRQLAGELLPAKPGDDAPPEVISEWQKAKSALVADFHWLVEAGHIIEFFNGSLDLPLSAKPKEPEPAAAKPAAAEPAVPELIATEPAASEPAASEPVTSEPVTSEPAASEPVASEPAASEPAASEPAATEPVATEPVATEPVASEPVACEAPADSVAEQTEPEPPHNPNASPGQV